jgi:putative peptide zinc metalloprotease protein
VTAGGAAILLLLLGVIPFPSGFRAPGVLQTTQRTMVANATAGQVTAFLVQSGMAVKRGQPLLQLQNRELELELANARAKLAEINARLLKAMSDESADIAPLQNLRQSAQERLQKFTTDSEQLTVRALHDGFWVAPGIEGYSGRWLSRGSDLGVLVNPQSFEFTATVMQEDVEALFARGIRSASVRLNGDAATPIAITEWRVIPGEQNVLPSAALGWKGGGEVPVSVTDDNAGKTVEPFFAVLGKVASQTDVMLLDGRSGKIRFALAPEPLLPRWSRRLWQLLQKRYQI